MSLFFELPTTGRLALHRAVTDPRGSPQTTRVTLLATTARQSLRLALKQCKRSELPNKDWLAVLQALIGYIPHLVWLKDQADTDALIAGQQLCFSWRPVLYASKLHKSKRTASPSIHYELAFCLLTLGLAMVNLASRTVAGLGDYEHQRFTSDAERKRFDSDLNNAAESLCKAAGVFQYLSDHVIPDWDQVAPSAKSRPLDLSPETALALSQCVWSKAKLGSLLMPARSLSMAAAERLAIRKLLSKAVYDATLTPGPPLPRSHPSPSLLAKLNLNVASLMSSAASLTKVASSHKVFKEPSPELRPWLRKYMDDGLLLSSAMAYKWLGVDLGEAGQEVGEAIAWLQLAQSTLGQLTPPKLLRVGKQGKDTKSKLGYEASSIAGFLTSYQGVNNRITYQPVPPSSALLSRVPGGRSALKVKPYELPAPFRAGQEAEVDLSTLALEGDSEGSDDEGVGEPGERTYSLATEYF